jgi:hypothetical protein
MDPLDQEVRPPSTVRRLLMFLIPLLLIAVAVNFGTILQIVRGEASLRDLLREDVVKPEWPIIEIDIPDDVGAADAKVVVEVFLTRRNRCDCHAECSFLGQALSQIDPARIRVVFRDVEAPETQQRLKELATEKLFAGLMINGQSTFTVPASEPGSGSEQKTIDLFGCPPEWVLADLQPVFDEELKLAYGGDGLPMGPAEFEARLAPILERLREEQRADGGRNGRQ